MNEQREKSRGAQASGGFDPGNSYRRWAVGSDRGRSWNLSHRWPSEGRTYYEEDLGAAVASRPDARDWPRQARGPLRSPYEEDLGATMARRAARMRGPGRGKHAGLSDLRLAALEQVAQALREHLRKMATERARLGRWSQAPARWLRRPHGVSRPRWWRASGGHGRRELARADLAWCSGGRTCRTTRRLPSVACRETAPLTRSPGVGVVRRLTWAMLRLRWRAVSPARANSWPVRRGPSSARKGSGACRRHPRARTWDACAFTCTHTSFRKQDPAAAFARADIDGSGDLTFDEWHLAFGVEEGVEADVLRALFDEFDAGQNGCVSLAEFQAGLKTVQQNACSAEELMDAVKTVALRWGLASYLSEDPLKRAIKKLFETQEDHSDTIRGLDALVKLGAKALKELGKMLGEALEKAPRVATMGERSFAAVAEFVKDLAPREMLEVLEVLEVLARYSRTKLMEAKACEEEIIGLRLYTGPLFVKTNEVLRKKDNTKGGNNYSNVIHAILSSISKRHNQALPGVRHSRGQNLVPRHWRYEIARLLLRGGRDGRQGRRGAGPSKHHH